jgi:tRNA nucleotidyltransferase (CCA-adding enzyme)
MINPVSVTDYILKTLKGGKGSGYFGHAGRPGYQGGSAAQSGSISEHRAQETSPEFRAWFEGSKVVDDNGLPLVMYHGTSAQGFTEFDKSKQNPRALYGPGFYFTENPKVASGETEGIGSVSSFEDIVPSVTRGYAYVGRNKLSRELTDKDVKLFGKILSSKRVADEAYSDIGTRETYRKGDGAFYSGDKNQMADWLANEGKNHPWILKRMGVESFFGGNPQTLPVYLNIKNPFDIEKKYDPSEFREIAEKILSTSWNVEENHNRYPEAKEAFDMAVHRHLSHGENNGDALYELASGEMWADWGGRRKINANNTLKSLGYDGISHLGGRIWGLGSDARNHRVFIAFEPTQIKSFYNSGDFDPNNPNILKEYILVSLKGGPGSGFFKHAGRAGIQGGSAARGTYPVDNIKPSTMAVMDAIRKAGGTPMIVGGYVRDLVLGMSPKDMDIEVYGLESDKLNSVLSEHGNVDAVGAAFGILKLDMRADGGDEIDISMPRRENKVGTGHRGFMVEVDNSLTPTEAASRRDFTMNAMSLDPFTGEILDPFGGREDLKNGILRHTSDAFAEDPLRVLRGVQFASRFNMTLAPETAQLCNTLKDEYSTLAKERLWGEWQKFAVKGNYPIAGLQALNDSGWIDLYPEIKNMKGVPQMEKYHPEGDVWEHTKHTVAAASKIAVRENLSADDRTTLVMTMLLHDTGKPETTVIQGDEINSPGHDEAGMKHAQKFLSDIGAPPDISVKVTALVGSHLRIMHGEPTARNVRRMADAIAPASIQMMSYVIEADEKGRPPNTKLWQHMKPRVTKMLGLARQHNVSLKPMQPILMGRHLIQHNIIKPGPAMGNLLSRARDAQVEGTFDNLNDAIDWAKANKEVSTKELILEGLKGGKGSGYFGHAGRIGKRGGSAPQGGIVSSSESGSKYGRVSEIDPDFKTKVKLPSISKKSPTFYHTPARALSETMTEAGDIKYSLDYDEVNSAYQEAVGELIRLSPEEIGTNIPKKYWITPTNEVYTDAMLSVAGELSHTRILAKLLAYDPVLAESLSISRNKVIGLVLSREYESDGFEDKAVKGGFVKIEIDNPWSISISTNEMSTSALKRIQKLHDKGLIPILKHPKTGKLSNIFINGGVLDLYQKSLQTDYGELMSARGIIPSDPSDQFSSPVLKELTTKGGPGSGNFGHAGIPGHVGGSAPANGATGKPTGSVDNMRVNAVYVPPTTKPGAPLSKAERQKIRDICSIRKLSTKYGESVVELVEEQIDVVAGWLSKYDPKMRALALTAQIAFCADTETFSKRFDDAFIGFGQQPPGLDYVKKNGVNGFNASIKGSADKISLRGKPGEIEEFTFHHENGHTIYNSLKGAVRSKWDKAYKARSVDALTTYSTNSTKEGFAESFGLWMVTRNDYQTLKDGEPWDETFQFFEELIGVLPKTKGYYKNLEIILNNAIADKLQRLKGGAGSGNFGHAGIPGHHGGSAPVGGSVSMSEANIYFTGKNKNWDEYKNKISESIDYVKERVSPFILKDINITIVHPSDYQSYKLYTEGEYVTTNKNIFMKPYASGHSYMHEIAHFAWHDERFDNIKNNFTKDFYSEEGRKKHGFIGDDAEEQFCLNIQYLSEEMESKTITQSSLDAYNLLQGNDSKTLKGGPGSGFFAHRGHRGRPGIQGGSMPSTTGAVAKSGITKTAEFKRWFGNSKVLDRQGRPLVVYHATASEFEAFDPEKAGKRIDSGWYGSGFYFSPIGHNVESYVQDFNKTREAGDTVYQEGTRIIPAFLKMENPLRDDTRGPIPESIFGQLTGEEMVKCVSMISYDGYVKASPKDKLELEALAKSQLKKFGRISHVFDGVLQQGRYQFSPFAKRMTQIIKKAGYDGVIVGMDKVGIEYVVFDPTQIKSAIGNSGAFDPNNPSIIKEFIKASLKGGPGSGFSTEAGHRGRPGIQGGSTRSSIPNQKMINLFRERFFGYYPERLKTEPWLIYGVADSIKRFRKDHALPYFFESWPDKKWHEPPLRTEFTEELVANIENEVNKKINDRQREMIEEYSLPETAEEMLFVLGSEWEGVNVDDYKNLSNPDFQMSWEKARAQVIDGYISNMDFTKYSAADIQQYFDGLEADALAKAGGDEKNPVFYVQRRQLWGIHAAEHSYHEFEVRHMVALGEIEPERAKELGVYSGLHPQGGREGWDFLPRDLYHCTTNLTAVLDSGGLKSRRELSQNRGVGLSGGEDDTISLTEDSKIGKDIERALHEAHMVANGKITVADMVQQAKDGWGGVGRDWYKELDTGGMLDGALARERRADTEDKKREGAWDFWHIYYSITREQAGGFYNPVFFGTDWRALGKLDPNEFGTIKLKPRGRARGYQLGAMAEWRTVGGDTMDIVTTTRNYDHDDIESILKGF